MSAKLSAVNVTIETRSATDEELSAKALLEALLEKYDTRRWTFTDRVVVEEDTTSGYEPSIDEVVEFILSTAP